MKNILSTLMILTLCLFSNSSAESGVSIKFLDNSSCTKEPCSVERNETDKSYVYRILMPKMQKENLAFTVLHKSISITGSYENPKTIQIDGCTINENRGESFTMYIDLPSNVKASTVSTEFIKDALIISVFKDN